MSTALYRRYRPETFADVIGQDHVTAPLIQALTAGRASHAYLFSGPRGCGKTTSARILARCLNCAQGPTPTPCGTCDSCVELARGGVGSLDVVEIDAASHGGVDDARELRERATMATARDRYRVYIIDEAHMVSNQGFNALLKVVEEPPEHVKFVFATTEPDKVLQTIRSRTHHYSFRLVPPDTLIGYLDQMCTTEGMHVGKGVLPLVVRAGAGSVRDSLSVLDQLMAGSGPEGIDYARAIALLGYTDGSMLDDVVSALGSADGAALFAVVDRVVESGHDPKRFADDLLERMRDLIVLQAMGEAADGVLRHLPPDQMERMRTQSTFLGAAELSRAADVVNAAVVEMVGASSPRMHLELLCARLLLPATDPGARGLGARIDRIERRLGSGSPLPEPGQAAAADPRPPEVERPQSAAPPEPRQPTQATQPKQATRAEPATRAEQASQAEQATRARQPAPSVAASRTAPTQTGPSEPAAAGAVDTETMRRMWPDLLRQVQGMKRSTWMIISANAQVHELSGGVLRLAFSNQGTARGFANGQHAETVGAAVMELLGVRVRVEPFTAEASGADPSGGAGSRPGARTAAPGPGTSSEPPPDDGWSAPAPAQAPTSTPAQAPTPTPPSDRSTGGERAAEHPPRTSRAQQMAAAPLVAAVHDVPSPDDPDVEDSGLTGEAVVQQLLGGKVIVEERPGR